MSREMMIGRHRVADDTPAMVCAEVASNHMGSVDEALALIDMAADCGAHAVKFQRRHNETLYTRAVLDAPYDHPHSFGRTYGEHRAALELPLDAYPQLMRRAKTHGLAFICTAFDEESASDLAYLNVDAIKIASGGACDRALISAAVKTGLPVIVSTGGCVKADITRVHCWAPKAAILHCTASYPSSIEELDLAYIGTLCDNMPNTVIGWSSHYNGIDLALLAWREGARIIEQHVTRCHANRGTDHAFSLEREGLRKLCRNLARAPLAMGDGVKKYYDSERKPIAKMRRRLTPEGMRITGEVDR